MRRVSLCLQPGLPELERENFLSQYREALDGAPDPAGWKHRRHVLRLWSWMVAAASKPGYYEAREQLCLSRFCSCTWDIRPPVLQLLPCLVQAQLLQGTALPGAQMAQHRGHEVIQRRRYLFRSGGLRLVMCHMDSLPLSIPPTPPPSGSV
jgi:hypothetical protein